MPVLDIWSAARGQFRWRSRSIRQTKVVNSLAFCTGTKNRHFAHKEIRLRHWQDAARALGLDFDPAAMLEDLASETESIAVTTAQMMPPGIADHTVNRTLDLFVKATKRAATGAAILAPV